MRKLRQLTEQEYFDLQAQYERTPSLEDGFEATGDHMLLRYMLRNMGYQVMDFRRGAEMELASQLLNMGYRK